jgi:putative signal transducing protein
MKLITIKESHYVSDLAVLKSKLESEGIVCNLKDEYSSQVLSHLANMMVKLQVSESDLPKVREILDKEGESIPISTEIVCPSCNSKNTAFLFSFKEKLVIAFSLIISLFTFTFNGRNYSSSKIKCQDCGNVFVNS